MSNKTEILSFDEWFDENESKFEYPRLAHKSAKQVWYFSNEFTIRLDWNILDLGFNLVFV